MDASEVVSVLDALDAAGIRTGMTGGWGVDALLGTQRRSHTDVDLGVAIEDVDSAIAVLAAKGYLVAADERPGRLELRRAGGQVDLHPIAWDPTGRGIQTGLDGQVFVYPPGSLDAAGVIDGRSVRCGTPELQLSFHLGYEPGRTDREDMAALASAFDLPLPPPYAR